VLVALFLGVNPLELLSGGGTLNAPQQQTSGTSSGNDEMRDFMATVLADTEDTWTAIFASSGDDYPEPTLTLFSGSVSSGCGFASDATGPFYCPADQNLYIDLSFYDELRRRFGAPGDFAQAYVLAHEVGHHVQNVLGVLAETQARQRQLDQGEANALSVRTELQADCLAGVWAANAVDTGFITALTRADIADALDAAAAVGDDRIQEAVQGRVTPESWTHGSSEQRQQWFTTGYESGNPGSCDTFAGDV
jgi:hypothetical protein